MDLLPLLATATGAVIALSGTLLADVRRDRRQRDRGYEEVRRDTYVDFVLALNAAHVKVRAVGDSSIPTGERRAACERAVTEADLFGARERLLMTATEPLVKAGETAFHRLLDVRNAIREGAKTRSREYHDAYHPFAEALWQFRLAVRSDFRQTAFQPESVDKTSWSERGTCTYCGGLVT